MEEALEIIKNFASKAWNLNRQGSPDKALDIALNCEEQLSKIGSQKYIANNYHLIGQIYRGKNNLEAALKFSKKALEIHEILGNQAGLAADLSLMGHIYGDQGNWDEAIKYVKQSLSIKEISPFIKLQNLSNMGAGLLLTGELSRALKYSEKGIKFAKEINMIGFCPYLLYAKGFVLFMKGDSEKSEVFIKKGLVLSDKVEMSTPLKGLILLVLIWLQINKNFGDEAKTYLSALRKFADERGDLESANLHFIAKGVILKLSSNLQDRSEGEILLKRVVDSEIAEIGFSRLFITPYALYFLCDFLIDDLGINNNLEKIGEITTYISKLHDLGEKINSYLVLTEVKVFQARLALIQLNLGEARILLTQAQQMAERHNLQYFAQIISYNHDRLLEQQNLLEQLKKTNAPISERLKLASFDGVLSRLKGRYSSESSEIINETPVLLLIVGKGGSLLFSKAYSETLTIESDLISSFLSAFESFGDELFSEKLDRIKFGENTILVKPLEDFTVCYLFKGQSYPALQNLTRFTEAIKMNSEVWNALNKSIITSEMLELDNYPDFKTMIDEIFVN